MEHAANKFAPWGFVKKLSFRFCFLLFALYVFFNPNGFIPYIDYAYGYYIKPFQQFVPWVGKHILRLSYDINTFTNGSGDTTYDYVIILLIFFTATVGSLLWTAIDARRKSYNTLYYWLTVVVRYYAAFTMLNYGFYKVFKLQFPNPSLNRLLEPYGKSSPMGLAWTYMGYSKGFNYFTGFGEVITGLLLLFRRTTLLGAILGLVVAGNIMAINYCFDVPVKLLSTTLVIMSLFLLLQERRRLVDFFITNRQAAPASRHIPKFKKKWLNISMVALKVLLIGYVLFNDVRDASDALKQYGDEAPKPALYGIYNVETFVKKHDTIPPLTTDTVRWSKLIISSAESAGLKMMDDSTRRFALKMDTIAKRITMFEYSDTTLKSYFNYRLKGKDTLLLNGLWKNKDSLLITMKKYDLKKFPLVSRGFNWINETPYNK